jgi:hypothetical protein
VHMLALLSLAVVLSQPAGTLHAQSLEGTNPEALRALRDRLGRGATVEYEFVNLANKVRSTVTLALANDDEYLQSNGVRLKELVLLVADARSAYSPPIPLAKFPLEAGSTWRHAGTISERYGIRASQIDCRFTVKGRTVLAIGGGPREAVEIHELRQFGGYEAEIDRWFDANTGLMLKEVWKARSINPTGHSGGQGILGTSRPGAYEMTVTRIP